MESNNPQIIFVPGGDSFSRNEEFFTALQAYTYNPYSAERKRWRDVLALETAATHDFLYIKMPNKENANYTAWKIWFDKVVPYLTEGAVLVGHSLGGGFLLRYLTEHKLPIVVRQLHLVAPCVDQVPNFGIDTSVWDGFKSAITETHLWHSTNDTIVPITQSDSFARKYPAAIAHTFTDRGHFLTETFPELVSVIKNEAPPL